MTALTPRYYDGTNPAIGTSLHLYYDVTMMSQPRYYDVTNPATMTALTLRYYDGTNPATMTSLTPLLRRH